MAQNIHISNVDNSPAMCFDTGLDPRSFARTKMSQSLVEEGFIVHPNGSHEIWKPSGVNEVYGSMRVFGPLFQGKRLDIIIEENDSQAALESLICWMKAKMFLGDSKSALNPGASFIGPDGSVFFAPEHLSNRCLFIEGSQLDRYNCPDLIGMDTSAFCAGVILYKILTGAHPYPGSDIYQDMREGVFVPINLAAPELNVKLQELIQAALMLPVAKKRTAKRSIDILTELLEIFSGKENTFVTIPALHNELPKEKIEQIAKERKFYLFRQNTIVKTRRFATQNKHFLIGCGMGLFFVLFIIISTSKSISQRPSTEGMASDTVVIAYYEAFSSLNHFFMEACINGADKTDINVAASFYAILRQRQAFELTSGQSIIPARIWKESGGELPSPNAFGVTDLIIDYMSGSHEDNMMIYRANYKLWSPTDDFERNRSDILTLRRDRRKNWRIIEILRTERL